MDKNRSRGMGKQIMEAIKATAGNVTGDRSPEMRGKGEKAAGKVQSGFGRIKDEIRAAQQQSRERKQR